MEPQTHRPQSDDPLRAAEDVVLTGRVHTMLARVAGGLLLPFGIFVLAFLLWGVGRIWSARGDLRSAALITLVFSVVGLFCTLVGYRLLFLRPNAYGSLLTPIGWFALAGLFGLTAVVLVVSAISSAHYESWYIPLACGGFGYRSYRAGFAARRRGALLAADR